MDYQHNLSILDRNVILGFQGCEYAERAYLAARDRPENVNDAQGYKAERFAQSIRASAEWLEHPIRLAAKQYEKQGMKIPADVLHDLLMYIIERQWRRAFPKSKRSLFHGSDNCGWMG